MTTTSASQRTERFSSPAPTRTVEKDLIKRYGTVAAIDEVGRGALAGPVCVGVAVVDTTTSDAVPDGLRDSKLLSPARRSALQGPTRSWVLAAAVGTASPAEIDDVGIIGAQRLAAVRALNQLSGAGVRPRAAILDGNHNWLRPSLFDDDAGPPRPTAESGVLDGLDAVRVIPKADMTCAAVAAASVLAKVYRDELMAALADPGYGWAANKGYGSAAHRTAIGDLGISVHHRRSWRLGGRGPRD